MDLERIGSEIKLLYKLFDNVIWNKDSGWVHISKYGLPIGWNEKDINIAFQIPDGYPGTPPYGIYVPSHILFRDMQPQNFSPKVKNIPPFEGKWGVLSWQPDPKSWRPSAKITAGSNLFNWALSITKRFNDGI